MEYQDLIKNKQWRVIIDWSFIIITVILFFTVKWFKLVFYFILLLFICRIFIKKWSLRGGNIKSAQNFISEVFQSKKEYCLILRPFGNDSSFRFNNINAETVFESIFFNFWGDLTIEQVIERVINIFNSKIETVALVDPKLRLVPRHPIFLQTANENWQSVVEELIHRALFVFIIIPEGTIITDSLIWELKQIQKSALTDRYIIVLPPSSLAENARVIENIKKSLSFLSSQIDFLRNGTIVIYPNSKHYPIAFINETVFNENGSYRSLPIYAYANILKQVLIIMNSVVCNKSFYEKYPYYGKQVNFGLDEPKQSSG